MFEIINTQRENPVKKCTNTFKGKILEKTPHLLKRGCKCRVNIINLIISAVNV